MTENNAMHYQLRVEPIDAIEAWGLDYNLGNAVKYICRAGKKVSLATILTKDLPKERVLEECRKADLKKALNYLHREIYGRWPWEEEE